MVPRVFVSSRPLASCNEGSIFCVLIRSHPQVHLPRTVRVLLENQSFIYCTAIEQRSSKEMILYTDDFVAAL